MFTVIVTPLQTMLVVYTLFDMPPQPGVLRPSDEVNDSPIDGTCGLKPGMHVDDDAVETVAPPVVAMAVSVLAVL